MGAQGAVPRESSAQNTDTFQRMAGGTFGVWREDVVPIRVIDVSIKESAEARIQTSIRVHT